MNTSKQLAMKCKNTTDGKHIFVEDKDISIEQHRAVDQGVERYYVHPEKCIACGMFKGGNKF